MKIVYLHGLESNIDQKDPKIIFLNNNFDEVYTPSINYKDKTTFSKLFSKIKSINPNLIVGSSMGGYFAYLIGSKLGIQTVLFNPAVIDRSFKPTVDDSNLKGAKHNVYLGKSDNVINSENVMRYFGHAGSGSFYYTPYKGGHRVPEDTFINAIKDVTGIKEQESTQIYKKRKFIMKHIRTINEEIINLSEPVAEATDKYGTKKGGKLNKNKKYKSKEYGEVVFMGYRNDMKTMMLKSKEKGMIRTSIHNEKTMVPIDESMNEGFSEWEMSFAPMVLSGVKLDPKNVYKVKARSTVEAIKKASKEAGLSGNDWMATVTNKLEKIK